MFNPCFIVICKDDLDELEGAGNYVLATRIKFFSREAALHYAAGISPERSPIVVECPKGLSLWEGVSNVPSL